MLPAYTSPFLDWDFPVVFFLSHDRLYGCLGGTLEGEMSDEEALDKAIEAYEKRKWERKKEKFWSWVEWLKWLGKKPEGRE